MRQKLDNIQRFHAHRIVAQSLFSRYRDIWPFTYPFPQGWFRHNFRNVRREPYLNWRDNYTLEKRENEH